MIMNVDANTHICGKKKTQNDANFDIAHMNFAWWPTFKTTLSFKVDLSKFKFPCAKSISRESFFRQWNVSLKGMRRLQGPPLTRMWPILLIKIYHLFLGRNPLLLLGNSGKMNDEWLRNFPFQLSNKKN